MSTSNVPQTIDEIIHTDDQRSFKILDPLGRTGQFAVAFTAIHYGGRPVEDLPLDQIYVVKMLRPDRHAERERVEQEAALLERLAKAEQNSVWLRELGIDEEGRPQHYAIRCYGLGTTFDGRRCLVLEHAPGVNVLDMSSEMLHQHVYDIALELAKALCIVHRIGYCHDDLRLDNLFWDATRSTDRLRIIDWNVTSRVEERPNGVAGDWMRFGACLYQMCTGHLLLIDRNDDLRTDPELSRVPPEFRDLITRALHRGYQRDKPALNDLKAIQYLPSRHWTATPRSAMISPTTEPDRAARGYTADQTAEHPNVPDLHVESSQEHIPTQVVQQFALADKPGQESKGRELFDQGLDNVDLDRWSMAITRFKQASEKPGEHVPWAHRFLLLAEGQTFPSKELKRLVEALRAWNNAGQPINQLHVDIIDCFKKICEQIRDSNNHFERLSAEINVVNAIYHKTEDLEESMKKLKAFVKLAPYLQELYDQAEQKQKINSARKLAKDAEIEAVKKFKTVTADFLQTQIASEDPFKDAHTTLNQARSNLKSLCNLVSDVEASEHEEAIAILILALDKTTKLVSNDLSERQKAANWFSELSLVVKQISPIEALQQYRIDLKGVLNDIADTVQSEPELVEYTEVISDLKQNDIIILNIGILSSMSKKGVKKGIKIQNVSESLKRILEKLKGSVEYYINLSRHDITMEYLYDIEKWTKSLQNYNDGNNITIEQIEQDIKWLREYIPEIKKNIATAQKLQIQVGGTQDLASALDLFQQASEQLQQAWLQYDNEPPQHLKEVTQSATKTFAQRLGTLSNALPHDHTTAKDVILRALKQLKQARQLLDTEASADLKRTERTLVVALATRLLQSCEQLLDAEHPAAVHRLQQALEVLDPLQQSFQLSEVEQAIKKLKDQLAEHIRTWCNTLSLEQMPQQRYKLQEAITSSQQYITAQRADELDAVLQQADQEWLKKLVQSVAALDETTTQSLLKPYLQLTKELELTDIEKELFICYFSFEQKQIDKLLEEIDRIQSTEDIKEIDKLLIVIDGINNKISNGSKDSQRIKTVKQIQVDLRRDYIKILQNRMKLILKQLIPNKVGNLRKMLFEESIQNEPLNELKSLFDKVEDLFGLEVQLKTGAIFEVQKILGQRLEWLVERPKKLLLLREKRNSMVGWSIKQILEFENWIKQNQTISMNNGDVNMNALLERTIQDINIYIIIKDIEQRKQAFQKYLANKNTLNSAMQTANELMNKINAYTPRNDENLDQTAGKLKYFFDREKSHIDGIQTILRFVNEREWQSALEQIDEIKKDFSFEYQGYEKMIVEMRDEELEEIGGLDWRKGETWSRMRDFINRNPKCAFIDKPQNRWFNEVKSAVNNFRKEDLNCLSQAINALKETGYNREQLSELQKEWFNEIKSAVNNFRKEDLNCLSQAINALKETGYNREQLNELQQELNKKMDDNQLSNLLESEDYQYPKSTNINNSIDLVRIYFERGDLLAADGIIQDYIDSGSEEIRRWSNRIKNALASQERARAAIQAQESNKWAQALELWIEGCKLYSDGQYPSGNSTSKPLEDYRRTCEFHIESEIERYILEICKTLENNTDIDILDVRTKYNEKYQVYKSLTDGIDAKFRSYRMHCYINIITEFNAYILVHTNYVTYYKIKNDRRELKESYDLVEQAYNNFKSNMERISSKITNINEIIMVLVEKLFNFAKISFGFSEDYLASNH